jgi:hypothetical protein
MRRGCMYDPGNLSSGQPSKEAVRPHACEKKNSNKTQHNI